MVTATESETKIEQKSGAIPLNQITESKTNPRRSFDESQMQELIRSVAQVGVLQPILVRPVKGAHSYELVAGARRFRAAKANKMDAIPATIRTLSDEQVLELQLIENLQRSDLHPYDEAIGYQALIEKHKHTAEELASRIGKSKGYIYARLKLLALPKKALAMFQDGTLDASRALLIARIPDAGLAEKAAKEITESQFNREPMSYREAQEHISENYMLRLKDAPFATGDAKLVPAAGACSACPKRTGNQKQTGLFADVQSADVCTDPTCFSGKCDAAWAIDKAAAKEAGHKTMEKAPEYGKFVRAGDTCYDDTKARKWGQLVKGQSVEKVLVRVNPSTFEWMMPIDKAKKAAIANGALLERDRPERKKSLNEKKNDLRKKAIKLAVPELVKKAEDLGDATKLLRFVARDLLRSHFEPLKQAGARRGKELGRSSSDGEKLIANMSRKELQGLIVEVVALDYSTTGTDYGAGWNDACKMLGFSMKSFEKLAAQPKKKAEKKPAKKKAKK
jgi:ParB/RepB/Spo0J family partition protein